MMERHYKKKKRLDGRAEGWSYAASAPPKPQSAPPHTTLQRSVRGAADRGAPARVIPRFHFPKGRPPPGHQQDHAVHKVQSAFATFPNSQSQMASGAVGERYESIGSRFAATSRTAGAGAAGPSDRHETGARSATGEDTRREIGQHSFPRLRMWNSRRRVRQARQAAESLRRKVPQSSTAGGVQQRPRPSLCVEGAGGVPRGGARLRLRPRWTRPADNWPR
ncbi:unnamed protein product [Plutella xylostella]|uniref:(diamondback moth) hypothetical protein n=1 Tax=Plutella xylostella TaxID=51655 RepID=A0A8S4E024_PLUXY|nr:unnamed protein product [Plutella xylostella]